MAILTGDQAKVDAVWGNPEDWRAEGLHWGDLTAVRRMNNRHVTGDESLSGLEEFFTRLAAAGLLPLARVLVIACGPGYLERELRQSGRVSTVVAVDYSPQVLDHARRSAAAAGITGIDYQVGDMNDLQVEGPFDAVFASSAMHHCENLEGLCQRLTEVLRPDGWLYFDDYVGPTRFQWPEEQVLRINRLLALLPDRLMRTRTGELRANFMRMPVQAVAEFDPSEAVRSAETLTVLGQYFDLETPRGYGGRMLHVMLAHIAQNFDADLSGDPSGPVYLQHLIDASDSFRTQITPGDDFAVVVGRPRKN